MKKLIILTILVFVAGCGYPSHSGRSYYYNSPTSLEQRVEELELMQSIPISERMRWEY